MSDDTDRAAAGNSDGTAAGYSDGTAADNSDRTAADNSDGADRTLREERSLTPMRKTIARRLHESYSEAVHVTVSREVDASAMLAAADAAATGADEESVEDADAVEPSLFDVLLRALSDALSDHPAFNATFEEGTHRIYEEQNVGVAVSLDQGLVTPVIADLGSMSLGDVARRRRALTDRVLDGDYTMRTFEGGTFTVSNLGPLGVDSFTPVINPPEVAILGVGRTRQRAVSAEEAAGAGAGDDPETGGEDDPETGVEFRPTLTLDLSFDHRVVDGADAARFLDTLADHVADAEAYASE